MMKLRLTHYLLIATFLTLGLQTFGQDTTSLRFAAFSDGGELILFKNDSTNLYYSPVNANASYNALFHHPMDGNLYCLHDTVQGNGDRDFYRIDPFSGAVSLVYNPTANFLAAACVGPNGIVYAVTGHGNGTPGVIYAYDLVAQTETLFATTDHSFGGANPALNISYHAATDELWLFASGPDTLIKIALSNQAETRVPLFMNGDGVIKATYFNGSEYWLGSDTSYMYDPLSGSGLRGSTFAFPDYITDIELLDLVEGGDTIGICGLDSALLRSRFQFDDYHWFHNGNFITSNARSINVALPGTYRLLAQYDNNGGFYMWSETVEVILASAVVANFGQSADTTFTGVAVNFTDSSLFASTYYWDFGDGGFSSQSSPSHTYTAPGVYTIMMVVQDGPCSDTAYSTIVVFPAVGISPGNGSSLGLVGVYPNPNAGRVALQLLGDGSQSVVIELLSIDGRHLGKAWEGVLSEGLTVLPLEHALPAGTYLLRLQGETLSQTHRLFVVR